MTTYEILEALDGQISRLQEARSLLASVEQQVKRSTSGKRGQALSTVLEDLNPAPLRRTMSAEGRARIAAAQRERWAKRTAGATVAKKSAPAAEEKARSRSISKSEKPAAKSPRKGPSPKGKSGAKKTTARKPTSPNSAPRSKVVSAATETAPST